MSSRAISGALNEATLLVTRRAIFFPASSRPLEEMMSVEGWLKVRCVAYLFNLPVSYAESNSSIISLRVYLPALAGILRRMSGSAGSIGRMNAGIFSYIACTPAMISVASLPSMLVPFGFALTLFLLNIISALLLLIALPFNWSWYC